MATKDLLITERQKVREKWEKSDSDINEYIKSIKEWIVTQKHLPEIPADEVIEFFLTNCKYSTEKTKRILDMHYTIRTLLPEIYENSNPNLPNYHQTISNMTTVIPLPKLTSKLHRIVVVKYGGSTENYDPYKMIMHASNLIEILSHEDLSMGLVVIFDNKNMKLGHVVTLTPNFFKKGILIVENSLSLRVAEIHLLNHQHWFMEKLLALVKTILKKKFLERINFHDDYENLYNYIAPEYLPSDYGGQQKSLQELEELWRLKFEEYRSRFDEINHMKVDEKLRPEPLQNSEILGYYGNFKKLDVD